MVWKFRKVEGYLVVIDDSILHLRNLRLDALEELGIEELHAFPKLSGCEIVDGLPSIVC
jgi:hypothetical protein